MGELTTSRHVLLAGGGTGGHLYPALALGEVLAGRGWRVTFCGRPEGLEARVAGERGLAYLPLPAKAVVGRGPLARVAALTTLGASAWRAARFIREGEVSVVVGTGGYVAAPAVLGARWSRRPALLFEPNARPGAANRWLSKWAAEAAVAHPETGSELACPAIVTGVPLRPEFLIDPLPLPPLEPPRILVLGGSQGALQLNEALPTVIERLAAELPRLEVVHQTGEVHIESTRRLYAARGLADRVELVAYLDAMAEAMAAAHLVVSRAGAITLAEICASGRPALLVPLALAGGHQADNARAMVQAGGAAMLEGDDFSAGRCAEVALELLQDAERLYQMSRAMGALARPAAGEDLADRVHSLSGRTA